MADVISIKIKIADGASKPLKESKEAVTGLGDAAERAKPKLSALDQIAVGAFRQIGAMATNMAGAAGSALLGFGKDTLDAAANFEDAMGDVAAISGATGEDFDNLRQTALDLGSSTAFSASEAAEGMKGLSAAGFTTNEIIAAMPGLLDAAAAGGVDLATATDVVSNTLRGFGLEAATSGHVADVLAMAANRSNADITGLGEALKYAGPVAASLGISMEDTTAAIGRMSDAGIKGSMAGTALRGIFTRLAAPTEKAAQLMDLYGINVFDAQGKMLPMPELIAEVGGKLEGLSDAERAHALSTLVGQEAMSGFLALMKAGPENLAEFSDALVNSGGSAQAVADIQLADFRGAMDALGGSVETFQIQLGSRALPALAGFVNNGLIPAINAATEMVDPFLDFAGAVGGLVVPALIGLGTAMTMYALVQMPTLLAANAASIASFGAQAAAVGLAILPYAAVAAAVTALIATYNGFNEKVTTATQTLLSSRQWWTDSAAAVDTYNASLVGANPAIASAAATVETLRANIESQVESLGKRMAAGMVSDAQYAAEMATINQMSESLKIATTELNNQIDAVNAETAAGMTATAQIGTMGQAHQELGPIVQLTTQEIQALGEQIQTTYREGGEALMAFAVTEAEFLTGVQERRTTHEETMTALMKEKAEAQTADQQAAIDERIAAEQAAYAEQESAAATSYSEQQAAQRAHLGSMLLDYVNAQAQLGNMSSEKAAEVSKILVEEYGIQEDSAAATFASMAAAIDEFATDGSASAADLVGALQEQEQAAVDSEQAMTSMAKEYTATAVHNFIETKGDADDYAETLRNIPAIVNTRVHTTYTSSGDPPSGGGGGGGGGDGPEGKASGGPVSGGTPYIVGEKGPELFVPDSPGQIIPADETAQILGGELSGSIGVTLSMRGDLARMIDAAVDQKLELISRGADNRRRMG